MHIEVTQVQKTLSADMFMTSLTKCVYDIKYIDNVQLFDCPTPMIYTVFAVYVVYVNRQIQVHTKAISNITCVSCVLR